MNAPKHLYEKVPTDLEDDKPQLPDEEALGVTYDQIDDLEGKHISSEARDTIENHYVKMHKRELAYTRYTWPKIKRFSSDKIKFTDKIISILDIHERGLVCQ